jgi:ribosomal protein L40E
LNLCPKCNGIARTPEAKQCRYCKYTWRNEWHVKYMN